MEILPGVRGRHLLAALLALLLVAAPARGEDRPFAPTSFWNAPLPGDAAVDPLSPLLVVELNRQVHFYGAWMNTDRFGMPVYEVPATQPGVHVALDRPNPVAQEQFDAVPLPDGARGAAGTDSSAIVWQKGTDTLWELWRLRRDDAGWHAGWGGRLTDVSTASGVFPFPYGVSAGGLSLLGGMIRPGELRAGRIDHALGISLPEVTAGVFRPPANRTDGRTLGGIPMGTRFRLDPTLNIRSLGLNRAAATIARAVQRYGLVVKDTGGAVAFYGEDPASIGSNPWPELFEGRTAREMLASFPWERMQALPPSEG